MRQFPPFQKEFVTQWCSLHGQRFKDQKLFEPYKTKAVHIMSYYGLPWYGSGLWGSKLTDINDEDHCGRTPLSLAAAMGHRDICEFLLLEGADMSHREHVYGQTPLSFAAAHGHQSIVELLLRKGSDYDDHVSGVTPLWLACRNSDEAIMERLLEAGANPNAASTHTGETCLSVAATLGHVTATHRLIEYGAKVNTFDKAGWTALHYAVSRGRKKTIEVLFSHLNYRQLQQLIASLSNGRFKSSWVTAVLSAIILSVYRQRGSESQTTSARDQNTQVPIATVGRRALKKPGFNGHKRKMDGNSGEDEYEEDDGDTPGKRICRPNPSRRRFACPYHKRNQTKFSSGECNKTGFTNMYRITDNWTERMSRKAMIVRPVGDDVTTVNNDFLGTISGLIHRVNDKNVRPIMKMDMTKTRPKIYMLEDCVLVIVLRRVAGKVCSECYFLTGPKTKMFLAHVSSKIIALDTKSPKVITTDFYDAADHEDKLHLLSTHYGQAIQQHCDMVMAPSTISRIMACESEDEIRLVLGQLIGDLGSNSRLPPTTTGSVPPGQISIVLSQQPTVSTQNPEPLAFRPPPEQSFFAPNGIFNNGNRSTFSDSTGLTSDANSSQLFQSYAAIDMYTDGTAPSDQMSTSIDWSWAYTGEDSSRSLGQLQQQMPPMPQSPINSIDYNAGFDVPRVSQGSNQTDSMIDLTHGSQHPFSYAFEGLQHSGPQPEGINKDQDLGPNF
ncbi:hypothetical protein ACHAPQ_008002 [Fusarium lateritium]